MKPESLFDGRIMLYRGDAIKIVRKLGLVDHVICDPPYEETMHRAKTRRAAVRLNGKRISGPVSFKSIGRVREQITPHLIDRCRGWFIAFCSPEGIAPWRDAIETAGARYKRACFWCKSDAAPQFNGQGPAYAVEPFVTAWCGRGVSEWNGGGMRNYWIFPTSPPERQGDHPTEKPLALMAQLLLMFTKPGDVVLDPFMGSGSTMLACLQTDRLGIGIENNKKYYALAKARIEAMMMGPEEGNRHIVRQTGKLVHAPGPLFGSGL